MAPQEPEHGSWLPESLRGLASHKREPGRLLPGVTIYHHPDLLRDLGGVLSFWPNNMKKHLLLEFYEAK